MWLSISHLNVSLTPHSKPHTVKNMHPNFLTICSYFSPIIFSAAKIGFGATVLIVSQIESAAYLMQFEKTLIENFPDAKDEAILEAPSAGDVRVFFEEMMLRNISCNKLSVLESIYFYHQTFGVRNDSVDEIAAVALIDDHNPDEIYKNSAFLDNGKKSDRFGLLRLMRNIFYDSAKRSVNQQHFLDKGQLQNLSNEKLELMIGEFESAESVSTGENYNKFLIFLRGASKNELKRLGIDGDFHIFHHRDEYASTTSELNINLEDNSVQRFLRYLKKTIDDETIKIEEKKSELDKLIIEVIPNTKLIVETALSAESINREPINNILIEIDKHYSSAKMASIRVNEFIFGSELAAYPNFLVREIIKKNDYDYLIELTRNHSDGIKGVYATDREEIFLSAYQQQQNEWKWKWIKLMIRTGFEFSEDQKKALFRDIIESNDIELLDLMIQNKTLNLFEYQKDRGITFYHLLLIDASESLLDHVYSNYIIEEPELKVKFIPNYSQNDIKTYSYWSPEENNFKLELPNFTVSGMKIRKNWDFLMISAAAGRTKIFRSLIEKGVDTSGYDKIKKYLKDQILL